ncbi:MAG TPA: cell surface protein, partial [Lactobacillus sp.]|nr:cell surface protein [Lactobacillus sp.]
PKEIYFEITDNGFRPLQVNQLKTQSVNIPVHATQDEMDLRLREFFKLPAKAKLAIKRYEGNPDVGKVGKTSAKVVVSEKLMSGKEVEATYDVPVQVVKRATFATQPITFNLGETVTMAKLGAMLASAKEYDDRDVKWGDQKLSINRPQAIDKLLNPKNQRLTKIGNPIDVTMRFDASTGSVLSTNTMKVGYGNAIAIKGYEMTPRYAGGVLALVKEQNQLQIVATDGLDDDNREVHSIFPKQKYLSTSLYTTTGTMLTVHDRKQLAAEITANGDTRKQQLLDQWGKDRIAATKPGDVLAVEHLENKVSWMQNGVAQSMPKRQNKKEWLFEVTDQGYRLLDLNQMVFPALTFENHTDPSKVEQVIKNEVAKQQASLKIESIDMPDLKTVGKKQIQLKVSQASVASVNQRIAYVYEIPIEVTEGSLS